MPMTRGRFSSSVLSGKLSCIKGRYRSSALSENLSCIEVNVKKPEPHRYGSGLVKCDSLLIIARINAGPRPHRYRALYPKHQPNHR